MLYPPSFSVIRYLRLGAKSYVLTVLTIWKHSPRYLQGRCDLGRAELGTATIAEHVETTCHSFRYYNYREAWSQWRVSKVIEELLNVRTSRTVCFAPWPCYVDALGQRHDTIPSWHWKRLS